MNLKNRMSAAHLQKVIEGLGYKWFDRGYYNVNIIGVRSPNLVANSFDDTMLCAYMVNGVWKVKQWQITTDAGSYWIKNPMNEMGCSLLVPNQYEGAYEIAKHRGKYDALCQRLKTVEVYRDNNRDQILDFDAATKEWGMFGINIHRSNPTKTPIVVGKWSAGCQVFKQVDDFDEFMQICLQGAVYWGNSFTYTLIKEEDLKL